MKDYPERESWNNGWEDQESGRNSRLPGWISPLVHVVRDPVSHSEASPAPRVAFLRNPTSRKPLVFFTSPSVRKTTEPRDDYVGKPAQSGTARGFSPPDQGRPGMRGVAVRKRPVEGGTRKSSRRFWKICGYRELIPVITGSGFFAASLSAVLCTGKRYRTFHPGSSSE